MALGWVRLGVWVVVLAGMMTGVRGATTPGNTVIPEMRATRIACDLAAQEVSALGEKLRLPAGEYHYLVWLPAGYQANSKREYPCLFIASPTGNATPQLFVDRLRRDGWMGIALVESKNGDWEPILGNFLAAHDDAKKRLRVAEHFKFMTGFSGAARASTACTALRPGFGGLLLQGAGFANLESGAYWMETLRTNPELGVYGIFGIQDPNRAEAAELQRVPAGVMTRRFALWEGGHQWASTAALEEGMDFLEESAYVKRVPADDAAKGQCVMRFQLLMARGRAAGGFAAYQAFAEADKMATAWKYADDAALAADAADAGAQMAKLAGVAAIGKEIKAQAAYVKAREHEDAEWVMVAGVNQGAEMTAFAKQAARDYEAVRKEYAETVFGRKAAARAVWLGAGGPLPK